jgi:hypothetical protein
MPVGRMNERLTLAVAYGEAVYQRLIGGPPR